MFIYETKVMNEDHAIRFVNAFDNYIGTEREINQTDDGYYIVCGDLEGNEADICSKIESFTKHDIKYPATKLEIIADNLTGEELAKKLDLKMYDSALPQAWLNDFTLRHNLDYGMTLFSTFFSYDGSALGYPVSAWNKAQCAIDQDFGGVYHDEP